MPTISWTRFKNTQPRVKLHFEMIDAILWLFMVFTPVIFSFQSWNEAKSESQYLYFFRREAVIGFINYNTEFQEFL